MNGKKERNTVTNVWGETERTTERNICRTICRWKERRR